MPSSVIFLVLVFGVVGLILVCIAIKSACDLYAQKVRNVRLIYSLSHDELSNPLQNALAALGNIEHHQLHGYPQQARDIQSLRVSLDKLVYTLRNLKSWMLVESAEQARAPERFNIVATVQSAIVELGSIAAYNNVQLKYHGGDHAIFVLGVEQDIKRVILNLVHNGIKHRQKTSTACVEISVVREVNFVFLHIADNGMGMSKDQLAVVGDPPNRPGLHQIGNNGSGLGLFVVKKLLNSNNISFDVKSAELQGTVFTIKMPLLES